MDYDPVTGRFTVTFDKTDPGDEPFAEIVIEVENPDGSSVTVTGVNLEACKEPGKNLA